MALGPVFLFLLCALTGSYLSLSSWHGMIYWYPPSSGRTPAAIKRVFDFSNLNGRALTLASHKRLIADAILHNSEDKIGIELGHFVTKAENGGRTYACDYYNKIRMTFHSADMSVNGNPSLMIIESNCNKSEDINRVATIWIPFKLLHESPERDKDLEVMDQLKTSLSLRNIGDRWPKAWTLNSISIYDEENEEHTIHIDQNELREINADPLTLFWPN